MWTVLPFFSHTIYIMLRTQATMNFFLGTKALQSGEDDFAKSIDCQHGALYDIHDELCRLRLLLASVRGAG